MEELTLPSNTPVSGGGGLLIAGQNLDLPNVAALRVELLDRLALGDVHVDLAAVSSCDLAGLQLLRAACVQAAADGHHCVLNSPSPAVLAAAEAHGIEFANLQVMS